MFIPSICVLFVGVIIKVYSEFEHLSFVADDAFDESQEVMSYTFIAAMIVYISQKRFKKAMN
jgi:Na+/glutamate symporter